MRVKERGGEVDVGLEILAKRLLRLIQAKKRSTTEAARKDDEADLVGLLSDDFDDEVGGSRHPLVIVSAIGPKALDERKQGTRDV